MKLPGKIYIFLIKHVSRHGFFINKKKKNYLFSLLKHLLLDLCIYFYIYVRLYLFLLHIVYIFSFVFCIETYIHMVDIEGNKWYNTYNRNRKKEKKNGKKNLTREWKVIRFVYFSGGSCMVFCISWGNK